MMMNEWDQIQEAVTAARRLNEALDSHAIKMAQLLLGRLNRLDGDTLVKLKRELSGFNSHTRRWNARG